MLVHQKHVCLPESRARHFIVQSWQHGHLVDCFVLALNAKLTLPVVTAHKSLTLLGNNDGAIFTTAYTFDDKLVLCDALESGHCRLECFENFAESGLAMRARPPGINVASICDKSTV